MLGPLLAIRWQPVRLAAFMVLAFVIHRGTDRINAEAAESEQALVPGLMPKEETGALQFLEQHPEFDGRGIVVAIFDTGVDPGAAGLQTTTAGQPKIVDIVDATGSGDVDTSRVVKPVDGSVTGRSGRVLKLNPQWKIPSGEVRIGMKAGYELFPHELVGRMKEHRTRNFMEQQRRLAAELLDAIDNYKGKDGAVDKTELEKRLAAVEAASKVYSDPGPVFDCVVFHDGELWRAAVDTDEDGDLADESAMCNFRIERQYSTFDAVSRLNFGVNIYEDGDVLSIVADSHPHGTHVAGIVAAHFPDNPSLNGVAPGAQIVSVKIGDTYLDGMETGQGLIRGVKTVLDNKCDLINMSFGEPTRTPDRGLVIRYFTELVDRHGVIFCASAGNAGPALSTVGAPGGTSSSLIGIGAHISPEMMAAQYALRERNPDMPYTWTSRGPTFDGDSGVDLFAPGGAIAPVPQWTLDRVMQMNGTSMASPNCCGNFALVLSGLKAQKVVYSPQSVRRAFENTARRLDDISPWAQGAGLIQTPAAFDALVRDAGRPAELLRMTVSVSGEKTRGIYLREKLEAGDDAQPQEFRVHVGPQFHPDAGSAEKVAFHQRLLLQSTAEWVMCGEQITVAASGEDLSVLVDPRELAPGPHYAEVQGIDPRYPERGPLFRLPVTVTRLVPEVDPDDEDERDRLEQDEIPYIAGGWMEESLEEMHPGRFERRFVPVPDGATWADLRLHLEPGDDGGRSRSFMIHGVQVVPGLSYRDAESNNFVSLQPDVEKVVSFAVHPGRTMELVFAQYWSSLGDCTLHYELTFHGITSDQRDVVIKPGDPSVGVEVGTPLHPENVAPVASLTTYRRLMKPASAEIRQLAEDRDGFPRNRRFHRLELTYEFTLSGPTDVTPRFLTTDDLLYDSEYGGTVWAIYAKSGQRVATDDIWPHEVSLGSGEYVLKLWVRHDTRSKLESLNTQPLALDRPLETPVKLPVYESAVGAVEGGRRFVARWISPGERHRLFIGNVGRIPVGVESGDILLGTVTYGEAGTHHGAGQRPGGFPLAVVIPTSGRSDANVKAGDGDSWNFDSESNSEGDRAKLRSSQRTSRLDLLRSLSLKTDRELFDRLCNSLLEQNPGDLTVLALRLHKLDEAFHRKDYLPEIVAAADAVIAKIDVAALSTALVGRAPADDQEAVKERRQAEKRRDLLIDTLYRKARAIGYREVPEVLAEHPITDPDGYTRDLEAAYQALARWADPTDKKYFLLHIRREARSGRVGEALKWLNQHSGAEPNYWHLEKRCRFYEQLGWTHLADYVRHQQMVQFPDGEPQE